MAGQENRDKRYTTEITGNEMKMLGGGRQDGDSGERTQQRGEPQETAPAGRNRRFEDMDDDIPFHDQLQIEMNLAWITPIVDTDQALATGFSLIK